MKKTIAISVGDLNGIGIELALRCHDEIKEISSPLYCINKNMLEKASKLLNIPIPLDFKVISPNAEDFNIKPSTVDKESGEYSYRSFVKAVELAKNKKVDAILTLPIHKKAWELAGINYKGHTDALRDFFKINAIMMLGCEKMFVALYTEHIPLKDISLYINVSQLVRFLVDFYKNIELKLESDEVIALLALNPHAGDSGVLGDEEKIIMEARERAHKIIGIDIYSYPLVPDIAFTPKVREKYKYFVAMYHDQGLAPLKALYFDEGINISLNLPIIRTSVDHGTAFDIAYKNIRYLNQKSYLNAIEYIVKLP
ncbi:MAG: 4-hydroxythreonine-4-phosphate dehydrogenase [Sulfurovum sp.]|nr:4-hydroxythreonine-4-phosphate dehydrogenase [Sulfurovaceae bacterium]